MSTPTSSFIYVHAYKYFSYMLMIYLHITISICANIRIQEAEPTVAHSSTGILGATSSPSDDQPPHAKKITEAFDIRYPNLPVVEVRPRVQVPLPGTYQVHAPPQTCRDILRVMSIQKKSENEERENKKRMAEKVVAVKNSSKDKRGGGERGGARKKKSKNGVA